MMTKRLQRHKESLRIKVKFSDALAQLHNHPGFTHSMAWEVMPEVRTELNAYAVLLELLQELTAEQVLERSGDYYRINDN
jgi:hypothetical protein